jgi:Uma2 family endonuclease
MTVVAEARPTLLTAEEAEERTNADHWELVRGEVLELTPPGGEHGVFTHSLSLAIGSHVRSHRLGRVTAAETGFILSRNPDTLRAPDIAFISAERVPQPLPKGWFSTVPDLVVEMVSPSDRAGEMQERVADWLGAGVRLLWLVYPRPRQVHVYRSLEDVHILKEADVLAGEDVLPGFSLPVAEIFA